MTITYSTNDDYLIPNILSDYSAPFSSLGKYAELRKDYLKEHKQGIYNGLLLSGQLYSHLQEIQKQAQSILSAFINQAKPAYTMLEGHSEQTDWPQYKNLYLAATNEVILNELIYSL